MALSVPFATQGYPTLGLSARTLAVPSSPNAATTRLRARVEKWEKDRRGHGEFRMHNLDRVPLPLAQESAHVYVSLREHFPAVAPQYVDVASRTLDRWYGHLLPENQPLAVAVTFEDLEPLRRHAQWRMSPSAALDLVDEDEERTMLEDLAYEWEDSGVSDVWASGSIDLSRSFASMKQYRELMSLREKPRRAHPSGTPSAVQHVLTPLSYAMVHEFGHLVDAELCLLGDAAMEHVYGELTAAVLGLKKAPAASSYGTHLVNYPTKQSRPGHFAGGEKRAAWWNRRALETVAPVLGRYACTNRDELFAEALVAAFAAEERETRRNLRRFRGALVDVGLSRARR